MFDGEVVLRAVSLELAGGKTHVVLGSSGSGKSTLVRLIAGILRPDHGTVLVDGILQTEHSQHELARRMGYVIQEGGLFPHLTARRNVTLKARLLRWPEPKIDTLVRELSGMAGLSDAMLARFPSELSGGQRQRVSLMRALMLDPPILLLDEPLGALDPIVRHELREQLRALFAKLGKTVVLVTHDVNEAALFGNTVTLMRDGAIVQHGSFRELLYQPADEFVTRFLNAQRPGEGEQFFA